MRHCARLFLSVLSLLAVLACPIGAAAGVATSDVNGKAPEYLARLIRDADAVDFTTYRGAKTVVTDGEWQQRMAAEVRAAKYRIQRFSCFCISFPEIRFLRAGTPVLLLTFHHGTRIRISSAEVSGDFEIGKDACGWIWNIVVERMPPGADKIVPVKRETPRSDLRPEVHPVLPDDQRPALPKPELPNAE